jgi:peroxiredoxin
MRAPSFVATFGFVAFALFSFSLKHEMRSKNASALVIQRGMVAPDFDAIDMNGRRVNLYETKRGNDSVLLLFWATWCDPCRVELTSLEKMYAGKKAAGVEFLAINLDPAELQNFPSIKQLPFPVLLDQGRTIAKLYGIRTLPSSLIVGPGAVPRVSMSMEGAGSIARMFARQ